jgi:hypothetical protein
VKLPAVRQQITPTRAKAGIEWRPARRDANIAISAMASLAA